MYNVLNSYVLNTIFMLIILGIIAVRAKMSIIQENVLKRCLALVIITGLYVIMDAFFIICDFLQDTPLSLWKAVTFLFYIVYILLPFVWYLFVCSFMDTAFINIIRRLVLIPLAILLFMAAITPFTGFLWSISAEGVYSRGHGYTLYSYLNYFYYLAPLLDIIVIIFKRHKKKEPYILVSIFISLVPLAGAIVNGVVIPVGMIFPLQPFCSVIVVLLGFAFIASRDSDALEERQKDAIKLSLQKAEEANLVKTRFLSDMSHDIRTPMNAIINLTNLALKEKDPEITRTYIEKIKMSGNFMLGLINDILDMSRIENGNFVLHKENLTVKEFLKMMEAVINPLIEKKNIHFHLKLTGGNYTISADKLRLQQIFFNLLSNAVKYTPEGGDIWFEIDNTEVNDRKLRINFVVRDNGRGMSEEFQKHLFEPFAREETDFNIKVQGTGLGLPIVKKLVDAMDGEITFKSQSGKGTEFVIVLYADIAEKSEEPHPAFQKNTHELTVLRGLKALVVEDNELNAYIEKTLLEKAGCIVTTADNGKEAVDLFCSLPPFSFDVILMDLRMPVMNGFEAIEKIRSSGRPDAKKIPVIAITADVFESTRNTKNFICLSKPIDAEKLYKTLKEFYPPRSILYTKICGRHARN